MTSNVTIVFNAVIEKLGELFPTKTRIPFPYSLTDNNKNFLSDGYGVLIGSSSYQPHDICTYMTDREISVVFTREVFRTDSDVETIDETVKQLAEDVNSTQALFYAYNELGVDDNIAKIDIVSTSGVEQVQGDKQNFLSMSCSFNFSIKENL